MDILEPQLILTMIVPVDGMQAQQVQRVASREEIAEQLKRNDWIEFHVMKQIVKIGEVEDDCSDSMVSDDVSNGDPVKGE